MASKVNVKFVVLLSAFLVLTGVGVGGAYYFVKMRSGDHYVALGDKAMKEGKVDVADTWYERAVGKEQFNVEWLKKWRTAREQQVPKLQTAYIESYKMYQGILRNLAQAQKTNAEAHRDYLQAVYEECAYSGSKLAWEYLANRVDEDLRYFEPEAPPLMRRYRGMALTQLYASDPALPQDRIELARQDLDAALAINPKDGQASTELAVWHRLTSERAKTAGDETKQRLHFDKSREVLTSLLAADPGNPYAVVMLLTMDAADVDLFTDPSKSAAELIKAKSAALDALASKVKSAGEALQNASEVNPLLVNRFTSIAPRIDGKDGTSISMALLDSLLAKDPDNMDLLLTKAQLTAFKNVSDASAMIAAYQKIIDLKDKPVSFAGVRLLSIRNRARFAQANASLMVIAQTRDDAERRKAIEVGKGFRTELARHLPEQSPELQFIDAKLAMYDGDIARARRLLAEFLKKPGDIAEPIFVEANLLMADVGLRVHPPEPGLSREHLLRVVAARPAAIEARLMLASVEQTLQNYEAAAAQLRVALDYDPDNAAAKAQLSTIRTILDGGKVDDPVMQAIIDAERLSRGTEQKLGDDDAAMKLLDKAFESNNFDPRLALVIATARFNRGDRDGAKQIVEVGLQKNTDPEKEGVARLRDLDKRLKATDSLEGTIAFINESPASEIDKKLSLFRAYTEHGKTEEAAKALNDAEKAAPNDPRVVDLRFQFALRANDTEAISRYVLKASELNVDQAEGDTFKARVQITQKNYRDAAATLARAVERGNAPASVYRLLGLVQAELGRTQDAMASFRRSIDLVPTDLVTIKMYLNMLVQANELTEALGVARRSEMIGRGDAEFLNAWLELESRTGRTDFAISRRTQMRERNPKDLGNAAALASLLLDQKAWAEARALIDLVRKEKDALHAVVLDARWHADQGNLEAAKKVYKDYIGGLSEQKDKQDAYIAFGQFLYRNGSQVEALAAFRQAARFQDPKLMNVDLMMGDVQLNSGLFEDAEQSYRRVLDAKVPDPDFRIRKRLVEALNQLEKFTEAEEIFKQIGAAADEDVDMLAQRASVARGLGDVKRAREILDRAVEKFPDEPMPYLRRARLLAQDPAYMRDAMADLSTAIKLRPGFWQALRTRALLHLSQGRTEDALRDLQEGVDRNPSLDDLRLELVDYLIRFGKENEAVDVADAALRNRPNDLRLMGQFASSFVRAGRWSRAARYFKIMWEQLGDEPTAVAYCDALLNSTPPGLAEAEAILATSKLKTDESWRLLVTRAHVRKKQNKDAAARNDLLASFEQLGVEPHTFLTWTQALRTVLPDASQRLTLLADVRAPAQLSEWLILARAEVAAEDPKNLPEVEGALRALIAKTQDPLVRGEAQARLAEVLTRQEKWEQALAEIRIGLQFKPNNAILCNNAAAILSEHLKKPREALPFAERACSISPRVWEFADTLASVYWALGDKAQALRKLADALRLAQREVDKANTAIKLATWRLESGDVAGARALRDTIRDMITDSPALGDSMKSELERLNVKIDAAPTK